MAMTNRELLKALSDEDLDADVLVQSVEDGQVVQTSDITEVKVADGTVTLVGELS
jgi:hypothetical protein